MGYETISMIVSDPAIDGAALDAAVALARRKEAHLDIHCLGVDPARYEMMATGGAAIVMESGIAEAHEKAEAAKVWVLSKMPAEMSTVSVQVAVVPQVGLDPMVARLVRYSDLIVASKPYQSRRDPTLANVLEAVLFGTGAPVLVVPPEGFDIEKFSRRVMVAWNESDECFTAIRQALPVLKAAESVDIVLVDPPSHSPERSDPGGQVCMMLSRHGIRAEVSILAKTMPRVADVLARFAREHDCGCIVMGAYGHSRFREAIIGGATRDMLEQSALPLMMSH
jgi:nucleotide-binding universal stress UspA family protein